MTAFLSDGAETRTDETVSVTAGSVRKTRGRKRDGDILLIVEL